MLELNKWIEGVIKIKLLKEFLQIDTMALTNNVDKTAMKLYEEHSKHKELAIYT